MSLAAGPRKSELLAAVTVLLAGIDGKQPGPALEQELNRHFGPGTPACQRRVVCLVQRRAPSAWANLSAIKSTNVRSFAGNISHRCIRRITSKESIT